MCEKQTWDVQGLENKTKRLKGNSPVYEVYIINPNVSMVIFLQKSVSMCSVAARLAAPSFPFAPHFTPWLVCTLRLEEAPWPWSGAGSDFPWSSWALQGENTGPEITGVTRGSQESAGRESASSWSAQGWAEGLWQHKEKGTCTVTWLGGEKGVTGAGAQSTGASGHCSPNEDVSAGIQHASDEVVWQLINIFHAGICSVLFWEQWDRLDSQKPFPSYSPLDEFIDCILTVSEVSQKSLLRVSPSTLVPMTKVWVVLLLNMNFRI